VSFDGLGVAKIQYRFRLINGKNSQARSTVAVISLGWEQATIEKCPFSMGLRSLESLRLLGNRKTVKDVQVSFIVFTKAMSTIVTSLRAFVVESAISLSFSFSPSSSEHPLTPYTLSHDAEYDAQYEPCIRAYHKC
jgi:hypothetical protein